MAVETWGATVADVRSLLRHVDLAPAAGSSNPRYVQATSHAVTDAEIQNYLELVAGRVSARIHRYEEVPERTREHVRTMARALVADGAAHYAQVAMFPASADPNNGSSYATMLWTRFQTGLDALAVDVVEAEAAKVEVSASGHVSHNFVGTWFPDEVRW